MKVTRNGLLSAALAMAALSPGVSAQEVPFATLYNYTGLIEDLPAKAPAVPAPRGAADKTSPGVAPETAYEELLAAPLWRSPAPGAAAVDLKAGFPPARHQRNRNVCSVFAALGLAEYLVSQKKNVTVDLSEEYLYYNAKLKFTDSPELQAYKQESGLAGYVAVKALTGGVVPEKEWPFQAVLPERKPVPPLTDPDIGVPPAGIADKTLDHRFAPMAVRRAEIKDFLARERRPVVINLMVYYANIDKTSGRIGDPSENQRARCVSSGDECGGHVLLLTGYDPAAREYLFRNSWGPDWGNRGFGRVSEKYVMQNCELCHLMPRLGSYGNNGRSSIVNAAYGWSAELK